MSSQEYFSTRDKAIDDRKENFTIKKFTVANCYYDFDYDCASFLVDSILNYDN